MFSGEFDWDGNWECQCAFVSWMSYAMASQAKDGYRTDGYPEPEVGDGHGMVAHGLSVTISAPSVF